jgi:beta-mannosidase
MELGGRWRATESNDAVRRAMADDDFDDSGWTEIDVPGHWRSNPAFAGSNGPIVYRRRFTADPPEDSSRSFLTFAGIFYQGDVWLDGEYVGDTEGYFFPHTFEVTAALQGRREHILAVEVACQAPSDRRSKRNLTGVFQHWDCIDPDWNPGGIWSPVRIEQTGSVRIASLKVLCREATAERAALDLEVELDSAARQPARILTTVDGHRSGSIVADHQQEQVLSAGSNVVRWRVTVENPDLWWPRALGSQPLHDVTVEVRTGASEGDDRASDRRTETTGLRQITLRNFIATINGERMFLKGANYGPTDRALARVTANDVERDLRLASDAGLDLLRVHAHIGRPELYDAADRLGMLIWQDLPLQWGYGQVRRQAVVQARQAVAALGHHPSIAWWCGHNEPMALDVAPGASIGARTVARIAAAQVLPTWNKTALDRSIRRALERADGSRAVVAHSGVLPHPAWGTDSHFYFGWYHGEEREFPGMLARFPVLARFVSEFGAQAVPESAEFMDPGAWPDLNWERLEAHHSLQKRIFDQRVAPERYQTFDEWRRATQEYQANLLRHHIEALRRLKYRPTGGFCLFMLSDSQPAVTWSVLDHRRLPKLGYRAVAAACAPVIITADRPAPAYRPGERLELDLHAVSDLRTPLTDAVAEARLRWPGGQQNWRFEGDIAADTCARIGRIAVTLPEATSAGDIDLTLALRWAGGEATNGYTSRMA